ncbi:helix-turn-helix transcriptional regulator [Bacillus sp. TL12]|uniref:helix-turn-helix domain-containing protein n=1 Tax=Bacillus sp. TL12 TaxID=2894756 RepID=UPI001F529900|nr:helix-turn-helix domain-containing protein [Bacillus sp. TL12]
MTNIREIRESKGISVKGVAIACDIPLTTLYDVETGRKSVLAKRAQRIAEYLDEPLDKLFTPTYYRAKVI